jgi:hypothetical protein
VIFHSANVFVNLVKLMQRVKMREEKKKLCSFNNENLDLHISYVPIYISRGSDYFF